VIASNRGNILLCSDTAKRMFQRGKYRAQQTSNRGCWQADYDRAVSEQTSLPWTTTISGAKGKKTPF